MYSWLSTRIGADAALVVNNIAMLFAVILIAWLCIALFRRRRQALFVVLGKNRPMRLSVRDAAAVDNERRIVLVRRDNVEHLLMIGGPSDVVIECNITPPDIETRAQAAQAATLPTQKKTHQQLPLEMLKKADEKADSKPAEKNDRVESVADKQPPAAQIPAASVDPVTSEVETTAEAVMQALEKAAQEDWLLKETESVLPASAAETIFQVQPQPAQKPTAPAQHGSAPVQNGTARSDASINRPIIHPAPQRQQQVAQRPAITQGAQASAQRPHHRAAMPDSAAGVPVKQPHKQAESAAMAAFTGNNSVHSDKAKTPQAPYSSFTTHNHGTGEHTPSHQRVPVQPAAVGPASFVKQQSNTVRKPNVSIPENNHATDFRPFLSRESEDLERLLQEELLRSQINLKTLSPNKN